MKYVNMIMIYTSWYMKLCWEYISLKWAWGVLTIDISIKYSIMSAQDRYIYTVQKVPVLARCTIVFKCFSYDVFMGTYTESSGYHK